MAPCAISQNAQPMSLL